MKKSEIRLYNILLPLWLLMFMPPALLVTIPVNFAVDSAVLFWRRTSFAAKWAKCFGKNVFLRCFCSAFLQI